MGLSSKQVSSDGHGWNQALLQASSLELPKLPMKRQPSQQQEQVDPMKCPRCESSNTKFCYYNNYNKSQPRYFCKACKRHWTKGGTLRNVPVGGGRKNKRKTSNSLGKTSSKTTSKVVCNKNTTIQAQLTQVGVSNDKILSQTFYQTVGVQQQNSMQKNMINEKNDEIFLGFPQNDKDPHFSYSNIGGFESNPCSISSTISSIQSPSLYNYTGETSVLEETVMNNLCWSMPNTSNSVIDMSTNWGWDDFDKFVSVQPDLTLPWDDNLEINP